MKVKISYNIEKEIDVTPEEYCNLRANHSAIIDIFPENSSNRSISSYNELSEKSQNELNNFLYRKGE